MDFKRIKTEYSNANSLRIGIICLSSPENLNIIEADTFLEIDFALNMFSKDEKTRVILLKSECGISSKGRKIFSAGVNLKKYAEKFWHADNDEISFKNYIKRQHNSLKKVEELNKPVIFAANGIVSGGMFEFALACDVILASSQACFSLNEVNIGLIPGYGSINRLAITVGKQRAFEIISSGREVSAAEAFNFGIITSVFADSSFEQEVLDFCMNLVKKSPNSLYLIKKTIREVLRAKNSSEIEEIEVNNFVQAVKSRDAKEGVQAFLEKRKPMF